VYEFKPDLILSDIALGKDNGYKFLRRLRKSSGRNIPFIFVSGKTKAKEVIHGLKSGADDYITKPFTYASLMQKIKKYISNVCFKSRPELQ
ncbi:MAG: response regulator, partial [Bacteroidales bacterium]|nr:response regulator [Bacteroidales bacterium]